MESRACAAGEDQVVLGKFGLPCLDEGQCRDGFANGNRMDPDWPFQFLEAAFLVATDNSQAFPVFFGEPAPSNDMNQIKREIAKEENRKKQAVDELEHNALEMMVFCDCGELNWFNYR